MTRALVTGGSGYFGSLLVRKLVERGDEVGRQLGSWLPGVDNLGVSYPLD